MRVTWGPFKDLSTDEMERLDARSREQDAGRMLPSGVRVIDLIEGTGPPATQGSRVWAHYKVWKDGFRSGATADLSFVDNRPYDWTLGSPTDRIPPGVDEGTRGMREGGWRRLVVPAAYGEQGLKKINYGPAGRYTGAKAPYVVPPGATAFVDLIMVDAGSGRCERLLRPVGLSEKEAHKRTSLTCSFLYEVY